jgi:N-acetylglucosamine kinase-like BadF-type ATPase
MESLYLGVDGGGTKTLAVLVDNEGELIDFKKTGPTNIMECGEKIFLKNLNEISVILKKIDKDTVKSCFGMSAIGEYKGLEYRLKKLIQRQLGIIPNLLVNDVVIAWAGGSLGRDSVHAVCGTGSIMYGKHKGKEVRVGGWGPLIGDEGSGFFIGIETLREVTKQLDRRSPKTFLTELIFKEMKFESKYDLLEWIKNLGKNFRHEIASISYLTSKASSLGDSSSKLILEKSAKELSLSVLSAVRLLKFEPNPIITYSGGVIENIPVFYEYFFDHIRQEIPTADIRAAKFWPVFGAIILLKEEVDVKFLQNLKNSQETIKKELKKGE